MVLDRHRHDPLRVDCQGTPGKHVAPFVSRRAAIRSLGGLGAVGANLVRPFHAREASAQQGQVGPSRLLVIQTPDGLPPETWVPKGSEQEFTLGSALRPFDALKADLVALEGIDHRPGSNEPHCASFVAWMTGLAGVMPKSNYTAAQGPSFDQVLAKETPLGKGSRYESLQLSGDMTTASFDVSHRFMSWAGKDQPLPGEHRPPEIFKRLFQGLVPADRSAEAARAVERVIAERRSVLDLLASDWKRMSAVLPAAQRPAFDAHLEAIRGLERNLEALAAAPASARCRPPDPVPEASNGAGFPAAYKANLDMVRLVFACDLSRVVTFMSSPSTSHLLHNRWLPGLSTSGPSGAIGPAGSHHSLSHAGDVTSLGRIGAWYSERIAELITALKATSDGAGSLLDGMLVVYGSELGYGRTHTPSNVPFLLFGKAGGRLRTGRFLSYGASSPRRTSNDLWVSVANALGLSWRAFGDPKRCNGPLPGLV
jgi:hypothetical protein